MPMIDRILSKSVIRDLGPAAGRSQGRSGQANLQSTTAFPRFVAKLKDRPRPTLLDLGLLCGENIAWLAAKGVKVFVDDTGGHLIDSASKTIRSPDGKVLPAPVDFSHLSYPAESFDGMLLWNLMDFMDRATAGRFLERLLLFMKPRCLLFAMSSYDRTKTSALLTRYRILNEDQIAYEEDSARRLRVHILENRELVDLFARFEILKSNLLQNQVRELLVEKK